MTSQDLIQEIQRQNPLISQEQILANLETERVRTGNLLCDETLLRLIAAKLGVQIQQNSIQINGIMPINRLLAGLNDVTVAGVLIAVLPVKFYQGADKSGKLATVFVADNEGIIRVVFWDDRVEILEKLELKVNHSVRLLHGYTKKDRYGRIELHLGRKSQIQLLNHDGGVNCFIEKFSSKIAALTYSSGNVILSGIVKKGISKNSFVRTDASEGSVMRFILADETGEISIVVWNERVEELDNIQLNTRLQLVNARVKEAQNGVLEIHIDSNTAVQVIE
jgi:ssDNA-binding replication factor A large subunit